jgi:hypothetical protein
MNKDTRTIKEKLLCSLFKSAKTTGELATELGYVTKTGRCRYNIIYKDLRILYHKKYLKSKVLMDIKPVGNKPTQYFINMEIEILRKMINEYPGIIFPAFKNPNVIDILTYHYLDIFSDPGLRIKLSSSPSMFKYFLSMDKSDVYKGIVDLNLYENKLDKINLPENSLDIAFSVFTIDDILFGYQEMSYFIYKP